jgi:hypothetical protein
MASNPQILSDLRVIHEADHQVELLTTYKGVPFICRAKIEELTDEHVQLRTTDESMVCLETDKKPRVLGSDYFEPSVAEVISIDLHSGLVDLHNLSYVGTKLGERMIIRVEPENSIPIDLLLDDFNVEGVIADISLNGIGVRVPVDGYNQTLKPGTLVNTHFNLPNGKIQLSGIVLSVLKLEYFYRLSIKFEQDGDQKTRIFHYLVDRRGDIQRELYQLYKQKTMIGTAGE